jgi:hypothetical protein
LAVCLRIGEKALLVAELWARRPPLFIGGDGVAKLKALPDRLRGSAPRLGFMPKSAEPFYQSREWKALVADRKRDPDYRAAKMRATRGERLILDHKVERKDGGANLDPANTEWLTKGEHERKTAAARRARATGKA